MREEVEHSRRHAESLQTDIQRAREELDRLVEENRRLRMDLDDALDSKTTQVGAVKARLRGAARRHHGPLLTARCSQPALIGRVATGGESRL